MTHDPWQTLPLTYVPVEFSGRARAFLERVRQASDASREAIQSIHLQLAAMVENRPGRKPRPEIVVEMVARLRAAGQFGRLGKVGHLLDRRGLTICETRLRTTRIGQPSWENAEMEPAVAIVVTTLRLMIDRSTGRTGTDSRYQDVAMIGIHALGRYYQRAMCDRSDATLITAIGDLLPVATREFTEFVKRPEEYVAEDHPVSVEVSGGAWRGVFSPVGVDGDDDGAAFALVIRTFV